MSISVRVVRIIGVALLGLGLVLAVLGTTTVSATTYDSAHSHWDIHRYTDFEFQVCYAVTAQNTAISTSEIANLPVREQDGQNNIELRTRTNGLQLVYRINGVATQLTSSLANPGLTFGVGSDVMYDLVIHGNTYDVYQLLSDGHSRGAHWYSWTDSHYASGVSASYYTIKGWQGTWEFVHGFPINGGAGAPHDLLNVVQDARNHPQVGTEATFDDPTPAGGDANSIISGGSPTFGLASGTNYTYTITESGSGSGTFDFRDPGSSNNAVFFTSSYYRLTLTSPAKIQRFVGSTASTVYTASSGGPGTYTVQMIGPDIYLKNAGGTIILHVNDGGPQSGLRVRLTPSSGQVWNWAGATN
jgi:hypothetical protein